MNYDRIRDEMFDCMPDLDPELESEAIDLWANEDDNA